MFGGIVKFMETFGGNDNFKKKNVGEMTTSRKKCGGNDNIKEKMWGK